MELNIKLPQDKAKTISNMVKEWRELSSKPLTNIGRLQEIEKEIGLQLTYAILQSSDMFENVF